jgi:1,4-dihydroxy-2-naphthoate octaprenyltransferase
MYFILAIIGLVLLHISVNTLNDYNDFKSGVDLKVKRTPFSGGSGMLPAGIVTPKAALALGLGSIILALPIGIYFIMERGTTLLPLFAIGAIMILFYTTFFTKLGFGMAEIIAGLGLGCLPVLGTFMIMSGGFEYSALWASMPSFFLVANLLLLNEFPDAEADKVANRKTLPIQIGYKGAAVVYAIFMILTYLFVVAGVIFKMMPAWTLLSLLTLPLAIKAIQGAFTFIALEELIPAQGANVMTVLLTQLLLGIGYMIAWLV